MASDTAVSTADTRSFTRTLARAEVEQFVALSKDDGHHHVVVEGVGSSSTGS
jgi:hypothetical protein